MGIAETLHDPRQVRVAAGRIGGGDELHIQRAVQETPQLLQRADPAVVHVDHHRSMIDSPDPPETATQAALRDHSSLESRHPARDQTSLEETVSFKSAARGVT